MKILRIAAVFLAMLLMGGYASAIEIGEYSDPAKEIKSEAGKIIIITLRSNKTTGYEWQLSEPLDTKVVDFMKSEYVVRNSKLVGSGGTEIWSFRAMGPGSARINLVYVRPWEKGVEPVNKVSFNIVVKEQEEEM